MSLAELLDDRLDRLSRWLGEPRACQPWQATVTPDAIRHFALGTGDDTPRWTSEAPPTFLYSCLHEPWDPDLALDDPGGPLAGSDREGLIAIWGADRWRWHHPVRAGDTISASTVLADLSPRTARSGEPMIRAVERTTFGTSDGELALLDRTLYLRGTERPDDAAPPLAAAAEVPHDLYAAELVRGQEVRVGGVGRPVVGDELPTLTKGPLTVTTMIGWLLGCGTSYAPTGRVAARLAGAGRLATMTDPLTGALDSVGAVHWSNDAARATGAAGLYDMGSQRISWAAQLVTEWCGAAGALRSLDARLLRPNLLGDVTYLRGRVTDIHPVARGWSVHIGLDAINQRAEPTLAATAVVLLSDTTDVAPTRVPNEGSRP